MILPHLRSFIQEQSRTLSYENSYSALGNSKSSSDYAAVVAVNSSFASRGDVKFADVLLKTGLQSLADREECHHHRTTKELNTCMPLMSTLTKSQMLAWFLLLLSSFADGPTAIRAGMRYSVYFSVNC